MSAEAFAMLEEKEKQKKEERAAEELWRKQHEEAMLLMWLVFHSSGRGPSGWLVFRRSWVRILAGSWFFFFRGFISHSLSKNIIHEHLLPLVINIGLWIFTIMAIKTAIRTAWRTTCHDWAYNGCKCQPGFQFCPALRESESVRIWLSLLGNAAYVACLPLLWQGSKWLNGRSVWLVFRRKVLGSNPSWVLDFVSWISFSLSQQKYHPWALASISN